MGKRHAQFNKWAMAKIRWFMRALAAIAVLMAIASSIMLYNLHRYESADYCASSVVTSHDCITKSTQLMIKRDNKTTSSQIGHLYGVVIAPHGKKTTMWFESLPDSYQAQAKVDVLSWNGRYYAIIDNGQVRTDYYWEPGVAKFMLGTWLIGALIMFGWPQIVNLLRRRKGLRPIVAGPRIGYLLFGIYSGLIFVIIADMALTMKLLM